MHTTLLIDDFIKSEETKMTWLDKVANNYPKVGTTKSIGKPLQDREFGDETVVNPSVLDKTVALLFLFFTGFFWIILLKMVLEYRFPFVFIFLGFLFVNFLIYVLVRNTFFNRKYIFTIRINNERISIDHNLFYWTDIIETCIMTRQEGKTTNHYLILFMKNKTIEKFDLFKFDISDIKISTIVEYYKTISAPPQRK